MVTTEGASVAQGEGEQLYATFLLDDLEFAIDVTYVQDAIICPDRIVSLPASPSYISGIIDIRDNIVPIIDTRKRFKMPEPKGDQSLGHIAITQCNDRYMGLIFDQINEVIRVKNDVRERLAPEFQVEGDLLSEVIKLEGGKRLIQIINPLSLFDYKDLPSEFKQHVKRSEATETTTRKQLVAFESGDQVFGIGVECIREIIATPELEQRIVVEEYIKGVISLRDELISIVDLHHFLAGEAQTSKGESRIIILQVEELTFGIMVNGIKEVLTYEERELQPMPMWTGNQHDGGFLGVLEKEGFSVLVLDISKIFATALDRVVNHTNMHDISDQAEEDREQQHRNLKPPVTYITFELDEVFGVEISHIREIVRYQDNIRHLPGQQPYIQGILNLRSEVIPVINLRHFFNRQVSAKTEKLIMVFTHDNKQVAILVDRLLEIRTLSGAEQNEVPKLLTGELKSECQGLVEQIIDITDRKGNHTPTMIIDVQKFIGEMSQQQPVTASNENKELETA